MDGENKGKTLLRNGHFWYQFVRFLGWKNGINLKVDTSEGTVDGSLEILRKHQLRLVVLSHYL